MGPAIEPSLVTCPTRMTAIPSPFARSIRRSVDSRTWPTLPAAPSRSSTVAVWIESTTTSLGRSARAASTIRPIVVSRRGPGRPRRTDRTGARDGPPGAGPGRATPRRSRTGRWHRPGPVSARPRPGGAASTCRSPARRRAAPAIRARARRRARDRARRCRGSGEAGPPRRSPASADGDVATDGPRAIARSERVGSRTTVSTSVFQPSQARHCPSQRRKDSPQDWQTKRLCWPRHR